MNSNQNMRKRFTLNKYLMPFLFLLFSSFSMLQASTKIMPLGDSITWDWYYNDIRTDAELSGYRNHLWYQLQDGEYSVDFVGSKTNGGAVLPSYDGNNEGYTGETSYQIAYKVYNLLENNTPDIILLHIGTNDSAYYSDASAEGVERILNEIDRFENDKGVKINVVLARIISLQNTPDGPAWVAKFNYNIDEMVRNRNDDVYIVDMEYGAGIDYSRDIMPDGIHPNDSGYVKMATAWYTALKNILPEISHPRMMADVNGDDMEDIIGFGIKGVNVALSTGTGFSSSSLWLTNFGYDQGWRSDTMLRKMADVNADGLADVVGFGNSGVYVSLSDGSGFEDANLWVNDFGYDQGWRIDKGIRVLADVDGDGMADVVGFGNKGVNVALSTGTGFEPARLWVSNFGYDQGWINTKGLRFMSDVDGDGKADIVGFGNNGVYIGISTGTSFGDAPLWVNNFGYNQGWRNDKSLRYMSDVDGDGKADIVGFGNGGVYVGISTGSGFGNAPLWVTNFGYNQGWRNDKGLRMMSDVDGDGLADIVGFGNGGVYVGISTGTSFGNAPLWVTNFGYDQGWRNDKHLRLMADVDGDGATDVVGFGNGGASVSTSTGANLTNTSLWINDFGYDQGWRMDFSPFQEQQ